MFDGLSSLLLLCVYIYHSLRNDERVGNHLENNVNKKRWSLCKEEEDDNINMTCLYSEDNAISVSWGGYGYLIA